MNVVSWEYAICEGLKVAGIEITPGISRGRPSYAHLYQIKFHQTANVFSMRGEIKTETGLSRECLSFTLPMTEIPARFENYIKTFLSRDPESGRSSENAIKFRHRQNLVKHLLNSVNIKRPYDELLVLFTTLLS